MFVLNPSLLNPSPQQRAARLAMVWALVCVLLAHGLLLGLWPVAAGPGWQAAPSRPMQVRQIVQTRPTASLATKEGAPALPALAMATPAPPARTAQSPTRRALPRAVASPATAGRPALGRPAPAGGAAPQAEVVAPASTALASMPTPSPSPSPAPQTPSAPEPGGDSVPVFATLLPLPFEARYAVQRGLASGRAELRWQRQNDRYELSLRTSAFGAQALSWASVGAVDEHGLAPERHTESRRNKELRAVNFQRDSGRISFSGPQLQYPLTAGAQDRLTWMLQLPAILQANPALAVAGAQVPLFVVGARGDAEVWAFQVLGVEAVDLPDGSSVNALHLKREPRRAYDTHTEVWLDPARQHLLVRALMRVRATGEGTEFLLDSYTGAKAP